MFMRVYAGVYTPGCPATQNCTAGESVCTFCVLSVYFRSNIVSTPFVTELTDVLLWSSWHSFWKYFTSCQRNQRQLLKFVFNDWQFWSAGTHKDNCYSAGRWTYSLARSLSASLARSLSASLARSLSAMSGNWRWNWQTTVTVQDAGYIAWPDLYLPAWPDLYLPAWPDLYLPCHVTGDEIGRQLLQCRMLDII